MAQQLYFHRSFDIQLSPVAASIIDWAPKPHVYRIDPVAGGDGAGLASCSSARRQTSPKSHNQRAPWDELHRRSGLGCSASHGSLDSCFGRSHDPTRLDDATTATPTTTTMTPTWNAGGEKMPMSTVSQKGGWFQQRQGACLANSYALVPLFARGTFSVNAGLLAALGVTGGFSASPTALSSPSVLRHSCLASDVLRVELKWGRMQWVSILNVVCFSWRSKSMPLCELMGMTPTTDWSMQADQLLFNWSGFWRMYTRDDKRSRRASLISVDIASEVTPLVHVDASQAKCPPTEISPPEKSMAETSVIKLKTPSSSPSTSTSPSSKLVAEGGNGKRTSNPIVDPSRVGGVVQEGSKADSPPHADAVKRVSDDAKADADTAPRWWRLSELRGGVGFAVKNDLASGVNVYSGCSAHLGRALTVSGHVDALRRACCSITSATPSLDLAARMRMNLITWHRTELDVGLGWRPIRRTRGLTCRLSHSMGRTSVGVSVEDVATQWHLFRRREGEWREMRAVSLSSKSGVPSAQELNGSAVASPASSSSWYSPYVGWVSRVGSSIAGFAFPSLAAQGAAEVEKMPPQSLSARQRVSHAAVSGVEWMNDLFQSTRFDLTVGATMDKPRSNPMRFFVVLSAN